VAILNALWRIVAGKRYDYSDPELAKVLTMVNGITNAVPNVGLAFRFPFLRAWFPSIDNITELAQLFDDVKAFLLKTIEEHKKNFDPDNPGDFIDTYLAEIKVISNKSAYGVQR
jgi:hypothetical protein